MVKEFKFALFRHAGGGLAAQGENLNYASLHLAVNLSHEA